MDNTVKTFNPTLAANVRLMANGLSVGMLRQRMAEAGYQIGQGTLVRALAGDGGLRLESLGKIARFFDLSTEALLQVDLGANEQPVADESDFVEVRRAGVKFSNGNGQVVYFEDDRPPLVFRADFLRRCGIATGNAVVVEADGISNEPKISDGSVVLVNRGDTDRLDGGFFAFRVDGELLIKRLEKLENIGILATAENPNYKPKSRVYMGDADFEVIGRAIWTGSML